MLFTLFQLTTMPKHTRKYVAAWSLAQSLGMAANVHQDLLYSQLNERSYYWDVDSQEWILNSIAADVPTDLIRVRVWASHETVENAAKKIRALMVSGGYEFLEQSKPYPCRPPKQLESRIYMSFR